MRNPQIGILAFAALLSLGLGACGDGVAPIVPQLPVGAPPQPAPKWAMIGDGAAGSTWASDVCGLVLGGADSSVVGGYTGTITLASGTPQARVLTGVSFEDSYLARTRASDGRLEWVVNLKSTAIGWVVIADVCETPNGIAVVGYFEDEFTIHDDAGAPVATIFGDALDDGFAAHFSHAGVFQWARAITSPGFVECLALTARPDGSIVVGGLFDGVMTPGGVPDTMTPQGASDSFLAAYDAAGAFLWSKQFFSDVTGFITAWAIAHLDVPGDDIVVTGDFAGLATFGVGAIRASTGSKDSFVTRLDGATGAVEWVQTVNGPGSAQLYDLGTVGSGPGVLIRIAGGFRDNATVGEPGGTQVNLASAGEYDAFVAALDGAGNVQWAQSAGGPLDDYFYDTWVRAADGAVMAIGYFTDTCDFSGSPVSLSSHGTGDTDALLAGYTAAGVAEWAIALGGTGDDFGLGISEVPGSTGDVYATGSATGPGVDLGAGLLPVNFLGAFGAFQVRFSSD